MNSCQLAPVAGKYSMMFVRFYFSTARYIEAK